MIKIVKVRIRHKNGCGETTYEVEGDPSEVEDVIEKIEEQIEERNKTCDGPIRKNPFRL